MTFDVGIGKCRSVQSDSVDVWVDGSIVRRLAPETKWQRDGISVLQVPSKLCSRSRIMGGRCRCRWGRVESLGIVASTAAVFVLGGHRAFTQAAAPARGAAHNAPRWRPVGRLCF